MLPDFEPFDAKQGRRRVPRLAERLRPFVGDATTWLHEADRRRAGGSCSRGPRARCWTSTTAATLTSPAPTAARRASAAGSGVPARHVDRWIGVVKAYTTRVGGGPFPTEQDNATGERIRKVGREFGTVTGRPRRCGWFDAVAARYSAGSAASTELAVMLLDVLSGLDELKVAVAYEDQDGRRVDALPGPPGRPASVAGRSTRRCPAGRKTSPAPGPGTTCRPRPGTTSGSWADQVGVPVSIVSVGPDREQTIMVPTDRRVGVDRAARDDPLRHGSPDGMGSRHHATTATSADDHREGMARLDAWALQPEQLPRHVAIIMDGNGRWAQRRGLPRIVGHRRGHPERPGGRRGGLPARPRAADALLLLGRELEAARPRADDS